jgi:hypothetical protein
MGYSLECTKSDTRDTRDERDETMKIKDFIDRKGHDDKAKTLFGL